MIVFFGAVRRGLERRSRREDTFQRSVSEQLNNYPRNPFFVSSAIRKELFCSRGLNCEAMLQIDRLSRACTRRNISICNYVDKINKPSPINKKRRQSNDCLLWSGA